MQHGLTHHSMDTHRQEREQRDATRKAAWDSAARNEGVNRNLQGIGGGAKKGSLADRAKYQFEADSEDDEMENEIDSNLGMFHIADNDKVNLIHVQMLSTVRLSASTNSAAQWATRWTRRTSTLSVSRARPTRWTTRLL
jgi:hypothetical protein